MGFVPSIAAASGLAKPVGARESDSRLIESALLRGEGKLTRDGALRVDSGPCKGRSSPDKFIVRESDVADHVWWDGNGGMDPADFDRLRGDMLGYLKECQSLVVDLVAARDSLHSLPVRVVAEKAWHALAIRQLLARSDPDPSGADAWTILDLPGFRADPGRHGTRSGVAIALSFGRKEALIAGTGYFGEIKKSVFSVLNYLLPARGVLPMHCAANHRSGDRSDTAVFFGLSGTGKTTLSAAPDRALIGDDEHGWSDEGVFNFEAGCYAKTFGLTAAGEPEIWRASNRFGSILENVAWDDESREADFFDGSATENGRAVYPLDAMPNAGSPGTAGTPRHVVMLACDAFGVLPPIARLDLEQAEYCFLSGFTSRVGGTEVGLAAPKPVFSACFGAPFLPRPPTVYARLLRTRLQRHRPACWMLNTGWCGGPCGVGSRMPLAETRRLLAAALGGSLDSAPMRRDPRFGFRVPREAPGIDASRLDTEAAWPDRSAYREAANRLVGLFRENFRAFEAEADLALRNAGPVEA